MKKIIFSLLSILYLNLILQAQEVKVQTVYFDSNQFTITKETTQTLQTFLNSVELEQIDAIKIEGHTDNDGSHSYNQTLSFNRAQSVKNYITSNNIDEKVITTSYKGESSPISSNKTKIDKQENRRVIVTYHINTFSIPESFKESFSKHQIDPKRKNQIKPDNKGTIIHVPENAFVDKNGNTITSNVTIQYREFTNSAEMAFSKIPMTYKNGEEEFFFNSAGMFEIQAEANNKPVSLAKGKTLTIDYALAKNTPEIDFYQLNNGKWTKTQDLQGETDELIEDGNEEPVEEREVNRKWEGKKMGLIGGDAGHSFAKIVTGLRANKLGVYNCDQIYRVKNRVNIQANYIETDGTPIKNGYLISMIDLNYNGAFSFSPSNFICSASGKNVIVLFSKEGDLYILDHDKFTNMNISESGKYTFMMKNMTDQLKTSEDLAKYLNL